VSTCAYPCGRSLKIVRRAREPSAIDTWSLRDKVYPNVDFYSGIIYRALGIPMNMFTVIFAIGRLPGRIAHWREMNRSDKTRIGRPRQIYVDPTERAFVPLEQR